MNDSDNDGWTHVLKGKKSARPQTTDPWFRNPIDTTRTAKEIQADFQLKLKTWQSSSCRTLYFKTLDQRTPDGGWPITKAVCLASGSFSRSNYESRQRSVFQFAAFVDTAQHIQERSSTTTPIRIIAQDPAYTPTDEEFLRNMGVEPIHFDIHDAPLGIGPVAEHIGPNTMLAELCIDMSSCMLRKFCKSGIPIFAFSTLLPRIKRESRMGAVFQRSPRSEESTFTEIWFGDEEEDARLAKDFVERYGVYNLPEFEPSPNTFALMKALIRRPDEEED